MIDATVVEISGAAAAISQTLSIQDQGKLAKATANAENLESVPEPWRSQIEQLIQKKRNFEANKQIAIKSKSDDGKVNDPIAKRTGTAHYSQGRILPVKKYDPDQPRDDRGRFGSGSGGSDLSGNDSLGIGVNGSPTAHNGKESYREKYGIKDRVGKVNYRDLKVDKERATEISKAYDQLPSNDPAAYPAYDALAEEVAQQYDYMTNELGIKVEFVDHDPYETARDMFKDVEENKTLQVLSTATTGSHSYLSDQANDQFRAVHDYFGHASTGRGFMQDGEEAAWVSHSSMFTDLASAALTTETRGQNSWYNNHDSGFAEQKTAILPQEFIDVTQTGYKSAKALLASLNKYDPDQPRDESGRFGSGGGGSSESGTKALPSPEQIAEWQSEASGEITEDGQSAVKFAYKYYGLNEKPTVSDEEFEKLKDEGATIVYRGVSRDSEEGMSPQDMTEQFRSGDTHYAGFGYLGNGTYTTTNVNTAQDYADRWDGTPEGGAVMQMALKPDANFISDDDISDKIRTEVLNIDNSKYSDMEKMWLTDVANAAIHFGYDGIKVEENSKEDYYILLNRNVVVMPEKDLR